MKIKTLISIGLLISICSCNNASITNSAKSDVYINVGVEADQNSGEAARASESTLRSP